MGQFSWITCDTKRQVIDNKRKDVYVLIPLEFSGGHITEPCYDGYGTFGGHDIYDLVADWNKQYVTADILQVPKREQWGTDPDSEDNFSFALDEYKRACRRLDYFKRLPDDVMEMKYGKYFKREIGIDIACRDEQNAALKYPIKIAELKDSVYESCPESKRDPNQGWDCNEWDEQEVFL